MVRIVEVYSKMRMGTPFMQIAMDSTRLCTKKGKLKKLTGANYRMKMNLMTAAMMRTKMIVIWKTVMKSSKRSCLMIVTKMRLKMRKNK